MTANCERLLVISYMHPSITPGGAQQVAFEVYKAARERGVNAKFLAALEVEQERELGKPGAPIVPMPGDSDAYLFFPQHYDFANLNNYDPRGYEFVVDLIERVSPDVISFHHYHRVGVDAILAARKAAPNAIISLTFHEMLAICMADGQMVRRNSRALCSKADPVDCHFCFPDVRAEFFELRRSRLLAAFALCDVFTFPTEFLRGRYIEWGLPEEKCFVVSNGQMNLGGPSVPPPSPMYNRFAFFGQYIDNKGIDVLLQAAQHMVTTGQISSSGIEISVNGGNKHYATADYVEKVESLVKWLDEKSGGLVKINLRGRYSHGDLASRMADADWVVVPSTWWEVFGLVVSEAWMFSRPVIASRIAGLEERIVDGDTGLLFTPRDPVDLARVMIECVNNGGLWRKISANTPAVLSAGEMFTRFLVAFDLAAKMKKSRRARATTER